MSNTIAAGGGWVVVESTLGAPSHVVPVEDLKLHLVDKDEPCWCRPFEEDGVIVHNARDKREEYERGERVPS